MLSLASDIESHVLARLRDTEPGTTPFRYFYIEGLFPPIYYETLKKKAAEYHHSDALQPRVQDNKAFVNAKYRLNQDQSAEVCIIRDIFSDSEIKEAFLAKFYLGSVAGLAQSLRIHDEFQFTFTKANRFQNIHLDIPPKYLSFVFYLPDGPLDDDTQDRNATILYDKSLEPRYHAKYRSNSACVFAPHFYSYHGFSTTIERPAMVLFYVNEVELSVWNETQKTGADVTPFDAFKDATQRKLEQHPLVEYGDQAECLVIERTQCLINAPLGRVMRPEDSGPYQHAYTDNIRIRAKKLVSGLFPFSSNR